MRVRPRGLRKMNRLRRGAALGSFVLLCGCADEPPLVAPEEPDTTSVATAIRTFPLQLYMDSLGYTEQTYAIGMDGEARWLYNSADRPDQFSWTSSDSNVVSIDPTGAITSLAWGTVTVTATDTAGRSASLRVRVADAMDPAWKVPLVDGGVGGGVTVGPDGTIYVGSTSPPLDSTTWHAVSPQGGTLWSLTLPSAARVAPAIGADGTLYIDTRTNDPFDGRLYAVDPAGSIKWSIERSPGDYALHPAIGDDGTIYTAGGDYLSAVDPDGNVLWTFDNQANAFASSPAVGHDGTIYMGGVDASLYAIAPDGTLRWTYRADDRIETSPIVGVDGTIYFGCRDGRLHAVAPDGTQRWRADLNTSRLAGVSSTASIGPDGTIYVTAGDIFAVDPSGSIRWRYPTSGYELTTPVVGADGAVYIASWREVLALDPEGHLLWNTTIPEGESFGSSAIFASPAIGIDGRILVGTHILEGSTYYGAYLRAYTENGSSNGGFEGAYWPTLRGNRANNGRAGG